MIKNTNTEIVVGLEDIQAIRLKIQQENDDLVRKNAVLKLENGNLEVSIVEKQGFVDKLDEEINKRVATEKDLKESVDAKRAYLESLLTEIEKSQKVLFELSQEHAIRVNAIEEKESVVLEKEKAIKIAEEEVSNKLSLINEKLAKLEEIKKLILSL